MGARRVVLDFLWKTTPKLKVMSWLDWEVTQRLEAVFIYLSPPPNKPSNFWWGAARTHLMASAAQWSEKCKEGRKKNSRGGLP